MKHYNILSIALIFTLFTACIEDKSTGISENLMLPDIKIEGIPEQITAQPFTQLTITPKILTDFSEEDLEYRWYVYNIEKDKEQNQNGYLPILIGEEKQLDYYVSIPSTRYKLIFKVVSKSKGVMGMYEAALDISAFASRGFFILKETEGGTTDVDLFAPAVEGGANEKDVLLEDFIKKNYGEALAGKPRHLDIVYGHAFLDPYKLDEGEEEAITENVMCVTTEDDNMRILRLSDFRNVYEKHKLFYDHPGAFKPYRMVTGYFMSSLFTDKGIFTHYHGMSGAAGRGTMGRSTGIGASTHITGNHEFGVILYYWDETTRSIASNGANGDYAPVEGSFKGYTTQNTEYDCVSCGYNSIGSSSNTTYFLLKEKNKDARYMFFLDGRNKKLDSVAVVSPTLHFAKAKLYAVNANQATIAYCVDDNRLFAYNIAGPEKETEYTLNGIPADETITYISNQYWSYKKDEKYNFDYLLIGTQKGNNYTLYMYKMVGGKPDGAPVHSVKGKGKISGVHYASPLMNNMGAIFNFSRTDN